MVIFKSVPRCSILVIHPHFPHGKSHDVMWPLEGLCDPLRTWTLEDRAQVNSRVFCIKTIWQILSPTLVYKYLVQACCCCLHIILFSCILIGLHIILY